MLKNNIKICFKVKLSFYPRKNLYLNCQFYFNSQIILRLIVVLPFKTYANKKIDLKSFIKKKVTYSSSILKSDKLENRSYFLRYSLVFN